jgi:integrase
MGGKMGATESVSTGVELATGARSQSIRIKFMFHGMLCRESLKLAHTKANINYATRLRGEILNAIEKNTFKYADYFPNSKSAGKFAPRPTRVTVGDLLREQLAIAQRALRPSTAKAYKDACDAHLFKQWDKTSLLELTPAALRAWIGTFSCKAKTLRNTLQPLSNALNQAVNDDLIPANPLDRVKLDKILSREQRKSEFTPDPFDMAEITAILNAATGQERNLWQFAFATGMRPSEYMALAWDAVDWQNYRVSVVQSRVVKVTNAETKTEAGRRKIDMLRGAFDALKAQQEFTALSGGLVFHDTLHNAGWDTNKAVLGRWRITLRKAKVRYRNLYQTRHTFASTLLSAGANPLYVAKQMGHRDTEMINRHYGRWLEQGSGEETRRQSADFFAKVWPKLEGAKPKPA